MANRVKVPVIMQMEALECGAASLAMVLAYHKKWVPLEQVRADCGVSRDGSNAKNMLRAARNYGMVAKGYRFGLSDIKKAKFPCIIHWNLNHFVVLCGFGKTKAYINDPARGGIAVSMEEFDKSFTGICLQFEPSPDFEPGGKPRSVVGFAAARLKGTLVPFLFVVITGILSSILGVLSPVFSRVFMDRILTGVNAGWLRPFILAMSAMVAVEAAVSLIKAAYLLKIEGKLSVVSNATFVWHVLRLPMEFFSQRLAGDVVSRQSANESIAGTLIQQLAPTAFNFVMLIFYLTVMLRYSPLLTAVGLTASVFNMVMARIISDRRVNVTRVQMRDAGKLAGATMAGISMIETIKASGAENGFFERWSGYQASVNIARVRYLRMNQYLGMIPGLFSQLADLAILMLGVLMIMSGHFTVGMLLAFQGFMASFMMPMNAVLRVGQTVQEMRTNMERVEDVMNYAPDVTYDDRLEADTEYAKLSGALELKNVTFGYSQLGEPLITDFSLSVKPGQRVAFVGASGCGKSTLSKLISGLYQPWSGEILFDGKHRKDIPREVFTGSLAVVDQDIILFEDTVADNIRLWDDSIEDFEMILAARDAHIHTDIMQREGGYGAVIREGGRNFSGGQRQRFELARVLAQDPTIVILDEATSALDAKTEFEVIHSIRDRGVTCIVVAHRLSTIRDCDEIIVMDRGKVVERGTHDELYARGGMYARLVSSE